MSDEKEAQEEKVLNLTLVGQEMTVEQADRLGLTMEGERELSRTVSDTITVADRMGLTAEGHPEVVVGGSVGPSGSLGTTASGERMLERFVTQQHVQGGTSHHTERSDGSFSLQVGDGYPIGRSGEAQCANTLAAHLQRLGLEAWVVDRDRDQRGEDRALHVGREFRPLQVVSGIVDQDFCRDAKSSATTSGNTDQMASMVAAAIELKLKKYGEMPDTVLALDFSSAPLASSTTVAERYRQLQGNVPSRAAAFAAVWLVGDSPERTVNLYRSSGSSVGAW